MSIHNTVFFRLYHMLALPSSQVSSLFGLDTCSQVKETFLKESSLGALGKSGCFLSTPCLAVHPLK